MPGNAVRSDGGQDTLDIHEANIEWTAQTTGCALLDVLTDDHHSGPRRKRPQVGITKDRILASDADAIMAWNVSRFLRNWREAAEDPGRLHGC